MTGDGVQVRYACSVTFSISEDYTDIIWCNVVPMDSGDILLDRPWMYDKNGTNGMRDHTYTFMHGEKQVTLHLMRPAPHQRKGIVEINNLRFGGNKIFPFVGNHWRAIFFV